MLEMSIVAAREPVQEFRVLPHTGSYRSQGIQDSASEITAPSCGHLLLVGHDILLQRTRASLLERVGFRCQLLIRADDLFFVEEDAFRVAVLCHTLPSAEACRAADRLRLHSPSTQILRLSRHLQLEDEWFEHVLVAPHPERFVTTVQNLSLAVRRPL